MMQTTAIIRTRQQLVDALLNNGIHYHTVIVKKHVPNCAPIETHITGIIRSVEREDGSGNKFNVTLSVGPLAERKTVFVQFNE